MDSDRPTLRPAMVKIKQVMSLADLAKALVAIGSAGATAFAIIVAALNWIATDEELSAHNLNARSHGAIQDRLERIEKLQEKLSARNEETRAAAVTVLRRVIRMTAADREPVSRSRAAAADFYEEEFDILLRQNKPLEDAFLEALRTPWHDRPGSR